MALVAHIHFLYLLVDQDLDTQWSKIVLGNLVVQHIVWVPTNPCVLFSIQVFIPLQEGHWEYYSRYIEQNCFSYFLRIQQGPPCCHNLMTVTQSYHSKGTLTGEFDAEIPGKAILLYVPATAFPAFPLWIKMPGLIQGLLPQSLPPLLVEQPWLHWIYYVPPQFSVRFQIIFLIYRKWQLKLNT